MVITAPLRFKPLPQGPLNCVTFCGLVNAVLLHILCGTSGATGCSNHVPPVRSVTPCDTMAPPSPGATAARVQGALLDLPWVRHHNR